MAHVVSKEVARLKLVVRDSGVEPAPPGGVEPASKLNDAAIAALKPRDTLYKVAAGGSLYLWIQPNGSKLWRLRFRLGDKQREYSIGPWGHGAGEFTLEAAQAEAARAKGIIAEGGDPVRSRQIENVNREAERARQRAEQAAKLVTFGTLAEDWFAVHSRKWSPAHKQAQGSRLDNEILPIIGRLPIGLIDAPRILELLRGIERRGKHELLGKCRIVVSQVFRYGVATARAKDDPTAALRGAFVRPPVEHRQTIEPKEFPAMFKALRAVPAEAVTKLAFYWCAATACRTGEMRFATWREIEEIEVEDGKKHRKITAWRVSASRMKMRRDWIQPLSPLAVQILERARALRTSDDDSAIIFPGFASRAKHGALSENALLAMLARAGYFGRMTTHGLRASASTWMYERGFDPVAVELCLAHTMPGVAGIYNRSQYLPQRLKILTAWGEHLVGLGLKLD